MINCQPTMTQYISKYQQKLRNDITVKLESMAELLYYGIYAGNICLWRSPHHRTSH